MFPRLANDRIDVNYSDLLSIVNDRISIILVNE